MSVPLVVTRERLLAMWAIRCVPSVRVMSVFLVTDFPHTCRKDFLTEIALEVPSFVGPLMVFEPVPVYKTHVAHITNIIPVVSVHVLEQHFERFKRGMAQGTVQ